MHLSVMFVGGRWTLVIVLFHSIRFQARRFPVIFVSSTYTLFTVYQYVFSILQSQPGTDSRSRHHAAVVPKHPVCQLPPCACDELFFRVLRLSWGVYVPSDTFALLTVEFSKNMRANASILSEIFPRIFGRSRPKLAEKEAESNKKKDRGELVRSSVRG